MSRIVKGCIKLNGVKMIEGDAHISLSGPEGSLKINKLVGVDYLVNGDEIRVKSDNGALAGTAFRLLTSAVSGVRKMFERSVEIQGSGTKVVLSGKVLELYLGYSHPVNMVIPDDISVSVTAGQKNLIVVKSMSVRSIGDFITNVKRFRKNSVYFGCFAMVVDGQRGIVKKKGGANG